MRWARTREPYFEIQIMLFMSWYCGNRCYCFVAAGGADAVGAAAGTAAVDRNGTKAPARLMQ